jgi:hypothetical protein
MRWIELTAWLVCALVLASGCASSVLSREAAFGEPRMVQGPGWAYRAEVALPFEMRAVDERADQLTLEIEDSVPITCFIWKEELELATTIVRTAPAIFEVLVEDTEYEISDQRISAIQGGSAGGVPYHAAHWTYRMGDAIGVMKVAAANKQGRGIACNHYDAGFSETFEQTFLDLVTSFEVNHPPPVADYAEVQVVRMGGLPVGVEWLRLTRDDEGDVRIDVASSLLMPRSASDLLATYSTLIEWSTPDGQLINAWSTEADVDTQHTRLSLRRSDERGWFVQGEFQGKGLDIDLAHEGPIDNGLTEWNALRERLVPHGDEEVVTGVRWLAEADPASVLEYELAVVKGDPSQVQARLGPLRMRGVRDAEGLIASGTFEAGNAQMQVERVHQRGAL